MVSSVNEMLAEAYAAVPRLDPAEVRNRMSRGDVLIVDVCNTPELTADGKLKGRPAFQKDKTVLAYCALVAARHRAARP